MPPSSQGNYAKATVKLLLIKWQEGRLFTPNGSPYTGTGATFQMNYQIQRKHQGFRRKLSKAIMSSSQRRETTYTLIFKWQKCHNRVRMCICSASPWTQTAEGAENAMLSWSPLLPFWFQYMTVEKGLLSNRKDYLPATQSLHSETVSPINSLCSTSLLLAVKNESPAHAAYQH